jgi:hypothetical protein
MAKDERKHNQFVENEKIVRLAKQTNQTDLERIANGRVNNEDKYDKLPEFLFNNQERKEVFDKLLTLLKRRFSLLAIADVLEFGQYDRVDALLNERKELFEVLSGYRNDDGTSIKMFLDFKEKIGPENSKVYAGQADVMRAALTVISLGDFLKTKERPEIAFKDIISRVIDNPDFSYACKLEITFINYEIDRIVEIIEKNKKREELSNLVSNLRSLQETLSTRKEAYDLMEALIQGKPKNDDEKNSSDKTYLHGNPKIPYEKKRRAPIPLESSIKQPDEDDIQTL